MEENRDQPLDPQQPEPQPRRFVYRSVEAEPDPSHPLRRATDIPREFHGVAGQICPKPQFLKMRVYLKIN